MSQDEPSGGEDLARELLAVVYEAQGNKAAAFTLRQVGGVGSKLAGEVEALEAAVRAQAPAVSGDVVAKAIFDGRPHNNFIKGVRQIPDWEKQPEHIKDVFRRDAASALSALPTIADARASALEEAAGVAEQLGQVVNARGLDNNLEAFAEDIAAAIRKLKDL